MISRWPWLKPELRSDEEQHREHKTTWLELFYDLVFVVVVAQFSHHFAEHPTVRSALINALFFLPILWSWLGFVFYNDRFETEDLSQRFFTLLKMAIVIAIALASQAEAGHGDAAVALGYVALRGLIVVLWLRAGWHNPVARPACARGRRGSTCICRWSSA